MPIIQIDVAKVSPEKKAELIEKMTLTAHEVLEIPVQAFTVIIREDGLDNIGSGGKQLSQIYKG